MNSDSCWFLAWLYTQGLCLLPNSCRFLRPWRWRRYVPPKRRLTFNWLNVDVSQKIGLFITTTLITCYTANRLIEGSQKDTVPRLTFQHATAPSAYACTGPLGQNCGSIRKICVSWVSILSGQVPSCNESFLHFEGTLIRFRNYM
jgi:hypothetical protein